MAPNSFFAFALFLSSYSPAFLILAIRAFDRCWALFWSFLALAILSAGLLLLYLKLARKGAPYSGTLHDVEPRDSDLSAYVATYLLPFLLVFGAGAQDVVALGVFLLFIGVLWVSSALVYLNPLLLVVGYHVYVVRVRPTGTTGTATREFLISKRQGLRAGDEVRPDRLAPGVLIDLSGRTDAD